MRSSILAIALVALVCVSLVEAGTRVPHSAAAAAGRKEGAAHAGYAMPLLHDKAPWLFEAAAHPEGTVVSSSKASPNGWALYKQCGESWSNDELGTAVGTTICDAGCAMSSVAMILKTKGADVNPGSLNSWLRDHGGYADRDELVWGAVDALGHGRMVNYYRGAGSLSVDGLASLASKGYGVVVNVRGGSHWVLVTGHAGGDNFYVNDPGFPDSEYAHSGMINFVVYG